MLVQFYHPATLSAARYDRYLAGGWFRGTSYLHRSKVFCMPDGLASILNIRLPLAHYAPSKSLRKLARRNDAVFQACIRPYVYDAEKEALYQQMKSRFQGYVFNTLQESLADEAFTSCFRTLECCIYHEGRLVAVSLFDEGHQTMASLMCLHDQAYGRYSLGIYTMLLEVRYAIEKQKKYYYPGYIFANYPDFDYKLRIGPMQYYNWQGRWISRSGAIPMAGQQLWKRMDDLGQALTDAGLAHEQRLYPLFTLGWTKTIFDEPFVRGAVLILLEDRLLRLLGRKMIVEYDLDRQCYVLSRVTASMFYEMIFAEQMPADVRENPKHLISPLLYELNLYETADANDLIEKLIEMRSVFAETDSPS